MEWIFDSNTPIYTQLVEQLTLRIVTSVYAPGQRIPPVRELAVEAGVNPNTMQRALGELERLGLVYSQRTSGRFVTEDITMIETAKQELASRRIREFLGAMKDLGFSGREIADLIEKMYGQFYTPQTVSNISRAVEEQVETFHSRPVSDRYSVIFCDATYLNVRRDSVAKEALHILIGITPDGTKELLDFALYPTESAENYKEMLNGLKERGVQQVLLFVTDGLKGLKSAVLEAFPAARYQSCWTHICRNVMKHIRAKDKRSVMDDLKKVYSAATRDDAISALHDFFEKYHKIYPKVIDILNDLEDLFTYYAFPKAIQRSIYTTNLIENFNKNLKRGTKAKEQFPNEDALERYVCSYCMDYNRRFSMRIHKGFQIAQAELMEMFRQ